VAIASNGSEVSIHICRALDEFIFFEQNIVILLIKPTSRSAHFWGFYVAKIPPRQKKKSSSCLNLAEAGKTQNLYKAYLWEQNLQ